MKGLPLIKTSFADPRRLGDETISTQAADVLANPLTMTLLDSSPDPILILNEFRQIILANDKFAALLGKPKTFLLGQRPGEALNCIHSATGPGGCGTAEGCSECGAVKAILANLETNEFNQEECRLTIELDGEEVALELDVTAKTVNFAETPYQLVTIRDLTNAKRREVLERIFFHDLLNIAGGLQGLLGLLQDSDPVDSEKINVVAQQAAFSLVEEITAQRDLTAAEKGELQVNIQLVDLNQLLKVTQGIYANHHIGKDRHLQLVTPTGPLEIQTDQTLLNRVIGNLVKNALEASRSGQTVTMQGAITDNQVTVTIHNETVMPKAVQLQMFQRSFSTKEGAGRGVGTWSIKLLTTRYLNGQISFRSAEGEGTTFTLVLPLG